MWLFFRADTGQEFVWKEEEREWVKIRRGSFAVDVANTWLAEERGKLGEIGDLKDEEEVDRVAERVTSLALWLAYGGKRRHLERLCAEAGVLPPPFKDAAADVLDVFDLFTDRTAWELWGTGVFPLAVGGRLGWACKVGTPLEAALKETVLHLMHGWPRPFKFCRDCFRFFHTTCPSCRGVRERKAAFLNLLRVHASRELTRLPPDQRREAVEEMDRIRREVKKRGVSGKVVEDYRAFCEAYGLSLAWYKKYRQHGL